MLADVAGAIGIDDVLRRHLPARHRRFELSPVLRPVDGQRREVPRRPGLASHPAQRERAFAVLPEHRAVAREFQVDALRSRSLDQELLATDGHRRPSCLGAVLERIGGIEFLDVQVLLVEAKDGESPGDMLVVAEGDPRQARLARADDVPSRSDEMNHVAQRRQREHTVRVIGKQRLAARSQCAGDRPVVASLAWLAGELDAFVAPDEILEQLGREPREIDTGNGIHSDGWIKMKQLRGPIRTELGQRTGGVELADAHCRSWKKPPCD